MRTVPLVGARAAGRAALVDDEDYELVSGYRWYANQKPATPTRRAWGPYASTDLRRVPGGRYITTPMHKLITGYALTDHRNGDGLDNRRANLREATPGGNVWNSRPRISSASQYKGVIWNGRHRKWEAQITVGRRLRRLGLYASELDAAAAYAAASLELQGEFAYAARTTP
jgi:hypothetical protein